MRCRVGTLLGLVAIQLLVSCTPLRTPQEIEEVRALLAERAPAVEPPGLDAEPLTGEPMTREAALRYALVSSPRLRAEYARLGIARADVVELSRLPNPSLGFSSLDPDDGARSRVTFGLSLPLADLLLLRSRTRLAQMDYERARFEVADALLQAMVDVERHWYGYVGARQVAEMRAVAAEGLEASAELAGRFFDAGNISELRLNQELAAATESRILAARAGAEALRARFELNAAIGLDGAEADWETVDRLALPVPNEDDPAALLTRARDQRLDLLAARREVDLLEDAAAVSRAWRWLGGAEIGYEQERESDGVRLKGPTLALELPIFNQGQGRVARASFMAELSRQQLAQLELDAEYELRLAVEQVRVQREIVELHRRALVPQREKIVMRSQQEQNYMLIGVFELVQAKAMELDAYQGYLEAVRDYWLARTELARAVGGRLPSESTATAPTPGPSVEEILGASPAPMQHQMEHPRDPPAHDPHAGHGHGKQGEQR